jgi:serine protease Do
LSRFSAVLVAAVCAASSVIAPSFAADVPVASTAPSINLRQTVTVDVVRKTKDAVVYISTTKTVTQRMSDPFFGDFGGDIVKVPANSLGSGFLIHEDGYVITNHHVIDRARQITVELTDGRKLPAELVSSDPDADLAILKVSADKPLPRLELGDTADLMIGEPVIAVGNPLGFSHSVSTGIVSAMHRELKDPRGNVVLGDLIQTDAAINPGNSGGPLLNAYGQVIGINTAIRGDAQNIGFAIPVSKMRDLIPELMNPAQVTKVDVPLKLKESRRIEAPATVITTVTGAGGAKECTSIAGHKPRDIVDAYALLLRQANDKPFEVAFAGEPKPQRITPKPVPQPDAIVQARERLGIVVEPLTPRLAERYGVGVEDGLLVTETLRNTPAAKAGLQAGDVIVQLGRYPVPDLNQFSALMQHLPDKGRVRIGVVRGDQVGYAMLQL